MGNPSFSNKSKKEVGIIQSMLGPVRRISISTLTPHPRNDIFPVESEQAFRGLLESMGDLGQIEPIIVRQDNIILCGHNRVTAARILKWDYIDGRKLTGPMLPEDTELRFLIHEQLHRRHLTREDRYQVYMRAFPNFEKRIMEKVQGGSREREINDSTPLSAWEVSDVTGLNVRTVRRDLQTRRTELGFREPTELVDKQFMANMHVSLRSYQNSLKSKNNATVYSALRLVTSVQAEIQKLLYCEKPSDEPAEKEIVVN